MDAQGRSAAYRHQDPHGPAKGMVKWNDILTGLWYGPDLMLTWARGSVCVFPQDHLDPIWVSEHLVRKVQVQRNDKEDEASGCDPTDGDGPDVPVVDPGQ